MTTEPKMRIYVNSREEMSRGKYAAAAVHAALLAYGVHPGVPVIILGAHEAQIETLNTVVRDAGRTEVKPGTITAGTDWRPGDELGPVPADVPWPGDTEE